MKTKKILPAFIIISTLFLTVGCSTISENNQHQISEKNKTAQSSSITETTVKKIPLSEKILQKMSLKEKICQLFIVTPEELTGGDGVNQAGETTKNALQKYPVGGIIYFSQNIISENQLKTMSDNLQSYSKISLLISTDEEGGEVSRIGAKLNVPKLEPMFTYKEQGEETAQTNAQTIAGYLQKYGINTDFAPVADVWSNTQNTVIGTRAYSDNFPQACSLVSSAVKGFKSKGEVCVIKHFPGHGDTVQDSHQELAHITKSTAQLKQEELSVFRSGIEAGADMVMVGHLIVDELGDNTPATLNKKIITDLLRKELNFEGAAVTDSMEMGAIANNYGVGNACVRSLNAGIDIILMPSNLDEAVTAVINAVQDGTITQKRIDEAVKRVIQLKINNKIIAGEI